MLATLENTITYIPAQNTVAGQVGNTPLLNLSKTARQHGIAPDVEIYAKAEWFNPSGSVKDRAALNIVETAEADGLLRPGMTLIDSTSGNTGIAYAMLGAAKGFKVKLVVPGNASPERIAILKAYGVELVLTDPLEGSDGAILEARRIAAEDPSVFYANQYNNDANWRAHMHTTAVEIWEQTQGRVTHFTTGLGTSGTFLGTTRGLQRFNPDIVCISSMPDSPFNGLEGWKHMPTAIKPGFYDETVADDLIEIRTEDAYAMARELARNEGIFSGISGAGSVLGALEVARDLDSGVVVTVLPDNGFKYLSERFWSEE